MKLFELGLGRATAGRRQESGFEIARGFDKVDHLDHVLDDEKKPARWNVSYRLMMENNSQGFLVGWLIGEGTWKGEKYRLATTHLPRDLVPFDAVEIQQVVEMHRGELCLAEHLVAELPSAFHHRPEHLVVRAPSEENLARVQLVQRTSDGPHVDGKVVGQPKDWCSHVSAVFIRPQSPQPGRRS